jgi:predicted phosphodiesterase
MREKILILADIHANGPALAAVLGAESDANRVLCLGDLVNYGPDPGECLRWARVALRPGDLVRGNHDLLAVSRGEAPSSGFPPVSPEVLHHTRARLTREEVDFLRELKPSSDLEVAGKRWHLVHAVPSDPARGLLHPEARPQRWELELALAGFPDVLLVAHTHRPFLIRRGDALIVNPGSVGCPKDGDPRASYAVWEDGRFELRKVEYRIEDTIERLRRVFRGPLFDELAGFLRRGGNEILDREIAA